MTILESVVETGPHWEIVMLIWCVVRSAPASEADEVHRYYVSRLAACCFSTIAPVHMTFKRFGYLYPSFHSGMHIITILLSARVFSLPPPGRYIGRGRGRGPAKIMYPIVEL